MANRSEEIRSAVFSADGNSDIIVAVGGRYILSHHGGGGSNYGGGTIKLQYSENGSNWADVAGTDATDAEQIEVPTGRGTLYRVNLNGSTSPNIVYSFRKTDQLLR